MPNNQRLVRKRRRLWELTGGKCFWCGRLTRLPEMVFPPDGCCRRGGMPDDMATIDHLYPKGHPRRVEPPREREVRWVMACYGCNNRRNEQHQRTPESVEYQRRRNAEAAEKRTQRDLLKSAS